MELYIFVPKTSIIKQKGISWGRVHKNEPLNGFFIVSNFNG